MSFNRSIRNFKDWWLHLWKKHKSITSNLSSKTISYKNKIMETIQYEYRQKPVRHALPVL